VPRSSSLSDKICEVIMTLLALRYSPPGWNGFVFTSFQKKKGPGIAKKVQELE
jgi:hypothetical protein